MFKADVLEDCLFELPLGGSFSFQGFKQVNEPARPQDPIWIYSNVDNQRRELPWGFVCSLPDHRQVYVEIDGHANLQLDTASFVLSPSADVKNLAYIGGALPYSKLGSLGGALNPEQKEFVHWFYCENKDVVAPPPEAKLG